MRVIGTPWVDQTVNGCLCRLELTAIDWDWDTISTIFDMVLVHHCCSLHVHYTVCSVRCTHSIWVDHLVNGCLSVLNWPALKSFTPDIKAKDECWSYMSSIFREFGPYKFSLVIPTRFWAKCIFCQTRLWIMQNLGRSATSMRILNILIITLPREVSVGQTLIACLEDQNFVKCCAKWGCEIF